MNVFQRFMNWAFGAQYAWITWGCSGVIVRVKDANNGYCTISYCGYIYVFKKNDIDEESSIIIPGIINRKVIILTELKYSHDTNKEVVR